MSLLTGACQPGESLNAEESLNGEIADKLRNLRRQFVEVCTGMVDDTAEKDRAMAELVEKKDALNVPDSFRETWKCSRNTTRGPKPPYDAPRAFVSYNGWSDYRLDWQRICKNELFQPQPLMSSVWVKNPQCPEDQ